MVFKQQITTMPLFCFFFSFCWSIVSITHPNAGDTREGQSELTEGGPGGECVSKLCTA